MLSCRKLNGKIARKFYFPIYSALEALAFLVRHYLRIFRCVIARNMKPCEQWTEKKARKKFSRRKPGEEILWQLKISRDHFAVCVVQRRGKPRENIMKHTWAHSCRVLVREGKKRRTKAAEIFIIFPPLKLSTRARRCRAGESENLILSLRLNVGSESSFGLCCAVNYSFECGRRRKKESLSPIDRKIINYPAVVLRVCGKKIETKQDRKSHRTSRQPATAPYANWCVKKWKIKCFDCPICQLSMLPVSARAIPTELRAPRVWFILIISRNSPSPSTILPFPLRHPRFTTVETFHNSSGGFQASTRNIKKNCRAIRETPTNQTKKI